MDDFKELEKSLAEIQARKEDRGALWIGLVFVFIATAIPIYQAILWLQLGIWHPMPISLALVYFGLQPPTTEWIGLQKILNWFFDLPVLVVPAFLAFGCISAWRDSR